jgi:hypothetical protein
MKQLCLIFPDQSNQLEFDFSEKKKSSFECRAKKCSNELRPDYTSQLDDRYCLDCMPW